VLQRRAVIDYALARRATLADLQRGMIGRPEVCDAHPYLLRAAKFHGEPTDKLCPLCRDARPPLAHVIYAFGDELGESSGRVRAHSELVALSLHHADLRVYVVEVCRFCSWNHLVMSFVIGTGEPSVRRRATGR
jgi:hypothetical protein